MFERVAHKHEFDETDLTKIKLIRKTNALKGGIGELNYIIFNIYLNLIYRK